MAKEKVISSNRIYLPLLFVGFSILMEMVNYMYLGFKTLDGHLMIFPRYFLFDLGIILMLGGIIFLCQKKLLRIVFYVFVSLHVILNIVNTTMYFIFGDILSFDLLKLGAEATTALSVDLIDWWGIVINLILLALVVTGEVLLQKKNKREIKIRTKTLPALILGLFILVQAFGSSCIVIQEALLTSTSVQEREIEESDTYLWNNFQFKLDAYKKFGHFGFYAKSIANLMTDQYKVDDIEFYQKTIDNGYVGENVYAPLYGDNLMVVLCESLDYYAIDPVFTPTLYDLIYGGNENSISFTNFYARNRTNISEGITLLGNMPRNTLLKNAQDNGYTFDYSLPKLFKSTAKDKTTKTQYVHENFASFYNRDYTHGTKGIGFDDLVTWEDYTGDKSLSFGHWIKDEEFSSTVIDKMFPTDCDRFLTYYTTLSTHGPFASPQENLIEYVEMLDEGWDELGQWMQANTNFIFHENDEMATFFKHYKAGVMDFDRTVKMWIDELEQRGMKDNTTILFFADHNSYYSNVCYNMKGVDKTDFSNTYINNIPLFIYSPHLTKIVGNGVNETFCNTYDILPTICDLYGLPKNTMLFQGYSIYSDDIKDSFFSSNLNGMFTKDIYSLNISEIYLPNGEVTDEEIAHFKSCANKFYRKQEMIERIYINGINGNKKII